MISYLNPQMGCQYQFLPPTPWHFLRPVSLLSDDRDVSGHSSIPGNLVPLLMKTSVTETWSLSATSCLVLSTWFLPPLFFCSVPLNVFSLDKRVWTKKNVSVLVLLISWFFFFVLLLLYIHFCYFFPVSLTFDQFFFAWSEAKKLHFLTLIFCLEYLS